MLPLGKLHVKHAAPRGIWEELIAYFTLIGNGPHRKLNNLGECTGGIHTHADRKVIL
jgi:hypothetical protein